MPSTVNKILFHNLQLLMFKKLRENTAIWINNSRRYNSNRESNFVVDNSVILIPYAVGFSPSYMFFVNQREGKNMEL